MLWHWYKLSLIDYRALLAKQYHRCALCGASFGSSARLAPAVDHDHITGVIRGIIHHQCNLGLGMFADNPLHLEQAALYLRTARTQHNANGGKYREALRQQKRYHGRE